MCISQVAINSALFWSSDFTLCYELKAITQYFFVLFHGYMARTLPAYVWSSFAVGLKETATSKVNYFMLLLHLIAWNVQMESYVSLWGFWTKRAMFVVLFIISRTCLMLTRHDILNKSSSRFDLWRGYVSRKKSLYFHHFSSNSPIQHLVLLAAQQQESTPLQCNGASTLHLQSRDHCPPFWMTLFALPK
jgi:hypothetical protein